MVWYKTHQHPIHVRRHAIPYIHCSKCEQDSLKYLFSAWIFLSKSWLSCDWGQLNFESMKSKSLAVSWQIQSRSRDWFGASSFQLTEIVFVLRVLTCYLYTWRLHIWQTGCSTQRESCTHILAWGWLRCYGAIACENCGTVEEHNEVVNIVTYNKIYTKAPEIQHFFFLQFAFLFSSVSVYQEATRWLSQVGWMPLEARS